MAACVYNTGGSILVNVTMYLSDSAKTGLHDPTHAFGSILCPVTGNANGTLAATNATLKWRFSSPPKLFLLAILSAPVQYVDVPSVAVSGLMLGLSLRVAHWHDPQPPSLSPPNPLRLMRAPP